MDNFLVRIVGLLKEWMWGSDRIVINWTFVVEGGYTAVSKTIEMKKSE
jgi:hypothetical protein